MELEKDYKNQMLLSTDEISNRLQRPHGVFLSFWRKVGAGQSSGPGQTSGGSNFTRSHEDVPCPHPQGNPNTLRH